MTTRRTFITMTAAAAALAGAVLGGSAAAAAEFEFSYASPYSPTHPYGAADVEWISRIEEQTDGRVKITPYWGRSLITSREGVDELAAGVADMAYVAPIYARSGYELTRNTPALFYGFADAGKVLDIYMKLWDAHPQFAEEMEGVHVLGFNVGTPMHLQLREKPVNTLDDLKGLRIRSALDYVGPLADFGAEGVTMPMTETYPALQKGVVDGVIAPYEALKSLSFAEVVKYYSELPHSRGAYPSRAINKAKWDSLPDDIKAVFDDNIEWISLKTLEEAQKAEDVGKAYGEEKGVQFNAVADEVKAEYAEHFASNAKEVAAKLDEQGLPGSDVLAEIRAAY
ncbi:TRAP transporter substrate-binding protein DctP [Oricola sp.]|uniref:TRAP transporter substrate-binding protein n=1 Tax=Oricola sp. TaxID=1979950 RepID=UPI0025F1F13A|nr:TRAP transporter substrate-binding protein DctP [Oricola sp.]MCI5078097.1 TRAP transporter substrate-binding protein DctP [Oricola sp.]